MTALSLSVLSVISSTYLCMCIEASNHLFRVPAGEKMNVQNLHIAFYDRSYYAGQELKGEVVLQILRETKLKGIRLQTKGQAEVKWSDKKWVNKEGEEGEDKSAQEIHNFYANDYYARMEKWVVGASYGDMILRPGRHSFPFSFKLPYEIPSSFEGLYGTIKYTAHAYVERPGMTPVSCESPFTVVTPVDLNSDPNMQKPVQVVREKNLCCLWCESGPITIVANLLPGYVPGQQIEALIECDNASNKEVTVTCYLQKTVTYRASRKSNIETKLDENTVASETLGTVAPNDSKTWRTSITVPELPSSFLKYCSCIDISYKFLAKGVFPGFHLSLDVPSNVVIGNVPL